MHHAVGIPVKWSRGRYVDDAEAIHLLCYLSLSLFVRQGSANRYLQVLLHACSGLIARRLPLLLQERRRGCRRRPPAVHTALLRPLFGYRSR